MLYFVIHLNCTGKTTGVIIPFHNFYCSVIHVLWPQLQLLRTLKSHCSHFKHERPAGVSNALHTKSGPNSRCSELVLSGLQWTLGPRNSRVNLFQKTYSNFRRCLQPELLSYPLYFHWVNITLILPVPSEEKVPCHSYTQTLHACSSKFCQVAKTSHFFLFYWSSKGDIYQTEEGLMGIWGLREDFLMDFVYSIRRSLVSSHCSRKQPLRERSPSHCWQHSDSTGALKKLHGNVTLKKNIHHSVRCVTTSLCNKAICCVYEWNTQAMICRSFQLIALHPHSATE